MSWDGYITNLTSATAIDEAAICGIAPGQESVWASSKGFTGITVEEIKKFAGNRSSFPENGVYINGLKCRMLRDTLDDEGSHTMDLKTAPNDAGDTFSVCVGKTKQALVIAKGKKDVAGGQVNTMVFSMAKYLREAGY